MCSNFFIIFIFLFYFGSLKRIVSPAFVAKGSFLEKIRKRLGNPLVLHIIFDFILFSYSFTFHFFTPVWSLYCVIISILVLRRL